MALAEPIESSSKVDSRGFYRALIESFSFLTTGKPADAAEKDGGSRERKLADATEPSPNAEVSSRESQKGNFEKEKGKKKKKEIVSSSSAVPRVEVCTGKKCRAKGSEELLTEFRTASEGRVEIAYTKCMKECKQGMNVRVTKDGSTFHCHHGVSADGVQPILCKHFDW